MSELKEDLAGLAANLHALDSLCHELESSSNNEEIKCVCKLIETTSSCLRLLTALIEHKLLV